MTEFYMQIISDDCTRFSVIIEDDGRVCYAYLLNDENIVGDVWLYNQLATPFDTIWDRENLPFLNPAEFVKNNLMLPLTSEGDIQVEWFYFTGNCILDQVKIFTRGKLTAVMKPGAKPGWAINVKKDGPLAKVLING